MPSHNLCLGKENQCHYKPLLGWVTHPRRASRSLASPPTDTALFQCILAPAPALPPYNDATGLLNIDTSNGTAPASAGSATPTDTPTLPLWPRFPVTTHAQSSMVGPMRSPP